jgi:hypothetical protein
VRSATQVVGFKVIQKPFPRAVIGQCAVDIEKGCSHNLTPFQAFGRIR